MKKHVLNKTLPPPQRAFKKNTRPMLGSYTGRIRLQASGFEDSNFTEREQIPKGRKSRAGEEGTRHGERATTRSSEETPKGGLQGPLGKMCLFCKYVWKSLTTMSNANWNGMPSHPQSSSNYGNQFNSIQPSTLAAPMRYDFNSGFHPTNSNFNNPSNLNQSQQQQFNPTAPSSSSAHSNYDSIPSGPSRGNGRGRGRGRGASGNRGGPRGTASFQSCDTSDRAESIDYSRGNSRGRGRGRGRGSRGGPSFNSSSRDSASTSLPRGVTDGNSGPLSCDFDQCTYKTDQSLALILHKADRHLIFPQGGEEELKRLDPMLIEEEKERRKKEKKRKGRDDDDEEEDERLVSAMIVRKERRRCSGEV